MSRRYAGRMGDARSPRPRRAVISTSVAVVATAIGSALVWQGAEALSRSASARMVSPPVEGLLFMLFGSVLLGVASVTILWSPAGSSSPESSTSSSGH